MPPVTRRREPIYAALRALLAGSSHFKQVERVLRKWTDVPHEQMPWAAVVSGGEAITPLGVAGAQARKHVLSPKVWIYVHTKHGQDPSALAQTQLADALDALEQIIEPPAGLKAQTLGGLVSSVQIAGQVETDEGVLGDFGLAIVPLEIVVAW